MKVFWAMSLPGFGHSGIYNIKGFTGIISEAWQRFVSRTKNRKRESCR
jgi:hypothetical protein